MPLLENPFSLHGEIALVTGGGTGIGFGISQCLVRAGAKVVIVGRREAELVRAVGELGSAASCIAHDITEVDRAGELIARASEQAGGPISILVNNAGNHLKKPAVDTTPAEFDLVLQTHVVAAHALTAAALPSMMEKRHGSILFTASMASLFGVPKIVAYSAAKSALLGLVRSLATEVAENGIRVNAIAPGWIQSAILDQAMAGDPERKAKILGRTPMARFGTAEDIGWAAVYLCSPAARFITGLVLPVDGGASIGF